MKTIKLLFSAILMMVAFGAQAQVVQVMKDGKVIKEYPASQVKSVEYKPVYYYYAGWECPKNEAELAKNGHVIENYDKLVKNDVIANYIGNEITWTSKSRYYIIIPTDFEIWDDISSCEDSAFTIYENITIDGYKVLISNSGSRQINAIKLVKK